MSNPLKQLAGQTAIYGLSSIIGRFLNYLLVPLHTSVFTTDQFGIVTEMYAYVAFLVILFTYGMETTFFRFTTAQGVNKARAFSTIMISLAATSGLLIVLSTSFAQPIAEWLKYPNNKEFVTWFAIIVGLDAVSSIPLARLRAENKPFRFVGVNIANVGVNILLNLFFLGYCLPLHQAGESNWLIETFFDPELGVSYVFIANLAASGVKFLLLSPWFFREGFAFDSVLLRKMLFYGSPLLVAGLAGIVNESIDKIMLKRMLFDDLGEEKTMSMIGIYGACYKLSIIMTLFIQAFRYAADPFYFSREKERDAKQVYSKVMNYFVIFCLVIFLGVTLFIDTVKYFVPNKAYWVGLKVVPILLIANMCLGIFYNLSFWYKLSGKTIYGLYLAVFGALITLAMNYFLIPEYNYVGSAWATLACYGAMVVASWAIGRRHYPIPYQLPKMFGYILVALLLFFISDYLSIENTAIKYAVHSGLFAVFVVSVWVMERPSGRLFSRMAADERRDGDK